MTELVTLQNDHWQVGVLPGIGASVAFGRIADGAGGWTDVLRPTDPAHYGIAEQCASYVLVPWSNRIRSGVLRFRDRTHQIARNGADGTAIHGVAKSYPWTVAVQDDAHLALTFASADVVGANFPWRFSARVTYALDGPRFVTTTTVMNDDDEAMPAGFGHHPYFERGLGDVDDEVELQIPCARQFELEGCMASAPSVPVEDWLDFTTSRRLGDRFIDENLTGRAPGEPIRFRYPASGRSLRMEFDEIFENVVLYVPQEGKTFFACEPVTNANDGFALLDAGIAGSGTIVLDPGVSATGSYALVLE